MEPKNNNGFVILALIGAGLYWAHSTGKLNAPSPAPGAPSVAVSADLQSMLGGCKAAASSQPDAVKRARFGRGWSDLAWVLSRETGQLTSGQLRLMIQRFEIAFLARTDLQGAFPGWSAAANDAALKYLGAQDAPIDRQRATDFLNGLSWACGG